LCYRQDHTFQLAQKDVDAFLKMQTELMHGEYAGMFPMRKNQCRGLLNLCIADTNKSE
jgi:hypothetical protein